MKKTIKTIVLIIIALVIVAAVAVCIWQSREDMRFVEKMGVGISIGNSLDATGLREYKPDAADTDYETYWNDEPITRGMLKVIHNAGFGTVRIPVSWGEHLSENGTINAKWLARVTEIAEMAMDEGLYVIINSHHEPWLDLSNGDAVIADFENLWKQIADNFRDYGEYLLFEGMNEPRVRASEYEWKAGTAETRALVNRLNTVFYDTVRQAGGYNSERYLLITPYVSTTEYDAVKALTIPGKRVIVSVHMYNPYNFCQNEDVDYKVTEADRQSIGNNLDTLKRLFTRKGIPVMLTEFGCKDKDNLGQRAALTALYAEEAKNASVGLIWWDNGSTFALMDRQTLTWKYRELVDVLVK